MKKREHAYALIISLLLLVTVIISCNPVTLVTSSVTNITLSTAVCGGEVISGGDVSRGVVWGTAQEPTLENNDGFTTDDNGTGTYTSDITDLLPETTYYVRAYAVNSEGVAYGQEVSFKTSKVLLTVDFSATGNSKDYVLDGWAGQESVSRWTNGESAGLLIQLDEPSTNNLVMTINARGYTVDPAVDSQTVTVLVNEQQVTSWAIAGTKDYETFISKDAVPDSELSVEFQISNPTKPCDFSDSTDCRDLGISVFSLTVEG